MTAIEFLIDLEKEMREEVEWGYGKIDIDVAVGIAKRAVEDACKRQRKIDIKAIYESTRINILVNGIKSKTMAEIINDAPLATEE